MRKSQIFNWILFGGIGISGLIAIAPVIFMFLAYFLTTTFHCEGNESGIYPCEVAGFDFGSIVAIGSVSPFLLFFSIPAGMLLAGAVVVVMLLINWKFKLNP
jgi:hypothetical protein